MLQLDCVKMYVIYMIMEGIVMFFNKYMNNHIITNR